MSEMFGRLQAVITSYCIVSSYTSLYPMLDRILRQEGLNSSYYGAHFEMYMLWRWNLSQVSNHTLRANFLHWYGLPTQNSLLLQLPVCWDSIDIIKGSPNTGRKEAASFSGQLELVGRLQGGHPSIVDLYFNLTNWIGWIQKVLLISRCVF